MAEEALTSADLSPTPGAFSCLRSMSAGLAMDAPMRREMTPVMKMEDFILMVEVDDEKLC
jgi:hypothetical protein